MKIAISASGNTIESPFNPRFGRCDYFLFYDTDAEAWEAFPNPAAGARGGAGPHAAQFIINQGVEVVISGRYGPNAFTALDTAGVKSYLATAGTVLEAQGKFIAGDFEPITAPTGPELHGNR